jgi:hypothetical protein
MLIYIAFIIGIAGVLCVSYGAWLLLPAVGFITLGSLCLLWSWMVTRAMSTTKGPGE